MTRGGRPANVENSQVRVLVTGSRCPKAPFGFRNPYDLDPIVSVDNNHNNNNKRFRFRFRKRAFGTYGRITSWRTISWRNRVGFLPRRFKNLFKNRRRSVPADSDDYWCWTATGRTGLWKLGHCGERVYRASYGPGDQNIGHFKVLYCYR